MRGPPTECRRHRCGHGQAGDRPENRDVVGGDREHPFEGRAQCVDERVHRGIERDREVGERDAATVRVALARRRDRGEGSARQLRQRLFDRAVIEQRLGQVEQVGQRPRGEAAHADDRGEVCLVELSQPGRESDGRGASRRHAWRRATVEPRS